MTITARGKILPLLAASALTLGLAACGGGSGDGEGLSGELTAAGASFPDAYYQAVIEDYLDDKAPDASIEYDPTGSGTGKERFKENLVDFAGTDSLVSDEDGIAEGDFLYVPTVAAPITVPYNLPDVKELHLSADVLADIFQANITKWDDPAIAKDNPDAKLPSTTITVAHRSDGSGTTSNFTSFLDDASDKWKLGAGDTVEWPKNSKGGEKNTGVADIVDKTEGAIGYVDLADATQLKLTPALIKNQDGEFVEPTLAGAEAALAGAEVNDDLSYNPLNAAGKDSYPITSPTFLLLRTEYDDAETGKLVKDLVKYILTDGQKTAADNNFSALPKELADKALKQLDKVKTAK